MWDRAEAGLRAALEATGRPYALKEGDGAFYGPKIDFDVTDSIGRAWQLGTIQLDYAAPERFDLTYVGEDNAAHRPVIIHRAVSGSLERFIAILIEHFAGAFPVWLAPEQVRVLPITDDYREYAEQVTKRLHDAGVRVHLDARSETLKYRVAEGARMKVPYMVVVGRREAEQGTVAVNVRGAGKEQKPNSVPLDEFVRRVIQEDESRTLTLAAHSEGGVSP
jgi:threonyl-tRNA synthetase